MKHARTRSEAESQIKGLWGWPNQYGDMAEASDEFVMDVAESQCDLDEQVAQTGAVLMWHATPFLDNAYQHELRARKAALAEGEPTRISKAGLLEVLSHLDILAQHHRDTFARGMQRQEGESAPVVIAYYAKLADTHGKVGRDVGTIADHLRGLLGVGPMPRSLNLKTDLQSADMETLPAVMRNMAVAVRDAGGLPGPFTLDGPEADWAGQRLGLPAGGTMRVTVLLKEKEDV